MINQIFLSSELNLKLENNINEQNEKIENKFNKYIYNFKDKSIAYVQENEKKLMKKKLGVKYILMQ